LKNLLIISVASVIMILKMCDINSYSFSIRFNDIIDTSTSVLIKAVTSFSLICTHAIKFIIIYKNLNFELIYLEMQFSFILILIFILLN
jgi:hypothetical protein